MGSSSHSFSLGGRARLNGQSGARKERAVGRAILGGREDFRGGGALDEKSLVSNARPEAGMPYVM